MHADSKAVREAMHFLLDTEFPQYRILEAFSGEEAIDMIEDELPNLVIKVDPIVNWTFDNLNRMS